MSGRLITDFIPDENMKIILEKWLAVRSEVADLEDWEPALVHDVERMFG